MRRTTSAPEPAMLDVYGVARRYSVRPATIWAWIHQGKLPQPLRLTSGCSRWSLERLKQWEAEKEAECAPRREWEERQRRKQQKEIAT